MLLTGTFVRALDEKLRFAIPKRLRDALNPANTNQANTRQANASQANAGREAESPALYLAPGTDGSLALYTETALHMMAAQLGQQSPTSQGVRAFSRLFYAQAQPVDMDRQGRVRVPTELAELAGLGREIVLLGVGDHLEIWDRRRWDEYLAEKQPQYDEIAERAFGPVAPSNSSPAPEASLPDSPEPNRPAPPRPR